ncbi:MAG: hypothetical protein ABNH34_00005 [Marinobacter sp.]|uniref:hypothetical protein n=1 Tax=Marinobacter TaxID=2742 RepID=UPI0022B0A487|nr:hypothetical protein [Marinobacter salarius]MCZ4286038.1 hypothetical protein [Marinobacter salarius]
MPRRSEHTFSLSGNLVALLALIFVVWTSVTVALPTLDDPVATTVALSDWQGSSESSEGASSPGDVSSLSPTFVYPPLTSRALHQLAFDGPPRRILSYPGQSQAPPSQL